MSQRNGTPAVATDALQVGSRLEEIAWALFLIMTGVVWLVPASWAPEGTWLAGAGLILLGLNAARSLYRLGANGFGIAVGLAALVAGVGRILGGGALFVPMVLIAVGMVLALRTVAKAVREGDTASAS